MTDVFNCLIRWLAPIIPFTSEEAWQSWKEDIDNDSEQSCHLLKNFELPNEWDDDYLNKEWSKILEIKNAFTFAVEQKRNKKEIKSPTRKILTEKLL